MIAQVHRWGLKFGKLQARFMPGSGYRSTDCLCPETGATVHRPARTGTVVSIGAVDRRSASISHAQRQRHAVLCLVFCGSFAVVL